jgi:hypothetical protein
VPWIAGGAAWRYAGETSTASGRPSWPRAGLHLFLKKVQRDNSSPATGCDDCTKRSFGVRFRWFAHPRREGGSKIELNQAEQTVYDLPRTATAR